MSDVRDVLPVNTLVGMPVLSRVSGNRLGKVKDLFIDPVNGVLLGLTVGGGGGPAGLSYEQIYSFGRDAIMAENDQAVRPVDEGWLEGAPQAKSLIGTKLITESGRMLGHIANVFVTLQAPPYVIYELRESIIDKLLGRESFILASAGYALSDDSERLVVPDGIAETAASNLTDLINQALTVRSFSPRQEPGSERRGDEVTWVPAAGEDPTLVRRHAEDDDETMVRRDDDTETFVRSPQTAGPLE